MKDGKTVQGYTVIRKGSPGNPMTREEREDKFRRLAGTVLPPKRIDQVIQTVNEIEKLRDVADLVALLVR